MSQEQWGTPDPSARESLPTLEDLPIVERGYDTGRVQEAFDTFYRRIALLDSTLQALEAVEAFQRHAVELRTELRNLRRAGWVQQPWSSPYQRQPGLVRPGIPDALPRIAIELAFIVAVCVFAGVSDWRVRTKVIVIAGAWLATALVEFIASRERTLVVERRLPPEPEEAPVLPRVAEELLVEPWRVQAEPEPEAVAVRENRGVLPGIEREAEPEPVEKRG